MNTPLPEVTGLIDAVASTRDVLKDPSVADVDDVAAACQTDMARGLTAAAATLRLARDGANELRSVPRCPSGAVPWPSCKTLWSISCRLPIAAAVALAAVSEGRPAIL